MGTEVLRPQDCFNRFKVSPPALHRRKSNFLNGNGFGSSPSYRKQSNRSDLKKSSPRKDFQKQHRNTAGAGQHQTTPPPPRRSGSGELSKPVISYPNPELDLSRVTILRRGKSLDSIEKKGSEKKSLSDKIVGVDVYAGSAIFVSPSPSCVPLPSFFSNKKKKGESDVSASRDLRRLLGLE